MNNPPPILFPGARYGPNGAVGVFQSASEVPKGWTDNPNDFAPDPLDHDKDGKKGGSPDPLEEEKGILIGLRLEYQDKFGKRPFMGWDADTLREKLG